MRNIYKTRNLTIYFKRSTINALYHLSAKSYIQNFSKIATYNRTHNCTRTHIQNLSLLIYPLPF